jgi:hypothetical protein
MNISDELDLLSHETLVRIACALGCNPHPCATKLKVIMLIYEKIS